MSRSITLSMRSFNDLQDKVAAIKGVRMLSMSSLRDAKNLVELVTPGHSERILIEHSVLEPRFSEALNLIKQSGLSVQVNNHNSRARTEIAEQIRGIVTYATMSAQYDISRALIDVMETFCPDPSINYEPDDDSKE